jgi:transcriptional regulator GlxA family with amidase domain
MKPDYHFDVPRLTPQIVELLKRFDIVPQRPALAKRLGMDEKLLNRFLVSEGTSFTALVLAERVRRAKELLPDSRFSMAEIICKCGLKPKSVKYFNQTFRNATGMLPNAYRNQTLLLKD